MSEQLRVRAIGPDLREIDLRTRTDLHEALHLLQVAVLIFEVLLRDVHQRALSPTPDEIRTDAEKSTPCRTVSSFSFCERLRRRLGRAVSSVRLTEVVDELVRVHAEVERRRTS